MKVLLRFGSFWRGWSVFLRLKILRHFFYGYTLCVWIADEILGLFEIPLFAPVAHSGPQAILVGRIVVVHPKL